MTVNRDFADYCCELLASVGPCKARRMFGGWGISVDGMSVALIADLGTGEKLWLKADEETRAQWLAAGCARFTYAVTKNGINYNMGMNYYSAPEEAMDSPDAMRPWARLALDCAANAMAVRLARSAKKGQAVKLKVKPSAKPKATPASKKPILKRAAKRPAK